MSQPLWSPSPERVAAANVTRFAALVAGRHGVAVDDYPALHAWSVEHPDLFWDAMWDFAGVVAERKGEALKRALTVARGSTPRSSEGAAHMEAFAQRREAEVLKWWWLVCGFL